MIERDDFNFNVNSMRWIQSLKYIILERINNYFKSRILRYLLNGTCISRNDLFKVATDRQGRWSGMKLTWTIMLLMPHASCIVWIDKLHASIAILIGNLLPRGKYFTLHWTTGGKGCVSNSEFPESITVIRATAWIGYHITGMLAATIIAFR